jgi:hypothetical protein
MTVTPIEIPIPAEYLPTGDHALILAWAEDPYGAPEAVLCLEDGRAMLANVREFKFDYRYDLNRQRFVDVSGVSVGELEVPEDEGDHGDTDQEPSDHGSEGVPGRVPEAD